MPGTLEMDEPYGKEYHEYRRHLKEEHEMRIAPYARLVVLAAAIMNLSSCIISPWWYEDGRGHHHGEYREEGRHGDHHYERGEYGEHR